MWGLFCRPWERTSIPRLTAVAGTMTSATGLVNEQAQVSLLLAGPGVIATLTFAQLVIVLALFREIRCGGGSPALDLSRHDPAGDHLAHGLHYLGKRGAKYLFLDRAGLDCRQCWSFVAMCGIVSV